MTRINVSGSLIMFYFTKLKCSTTPSNWIMLSLLTLNIFASNFSHFPHFYLGYVVTISVWESWGLLQSPLLPAALEDRSVTIICIFLWKALECVVVWRLCSQLHVLLNRFVRITSLKSDSQNIPHDLWCPRKEVLSQDSVCLSSHYDKVKTRSTLKFGDTLDRTLKVSQPLLLDTLWTERPGCLSCPDFRF